MNEQSSMLQQSVLTEASVRQQVGELLASNRREGFSGLLRRHYCYIAPSPGT